MHYASVLCLTLAVFIAAESIGQLQKDLNAAKEIQWHVKSQHQAGLRFLKLSQEETNKLKTEK